MPESAFSAGADAHIRDYSGHKPIHYVKSMSLPLQSKPDLNAPAWRRHFYAGSQPQFLTGEGLAKLRDHDANGHALKKDEKGEYDQGGSKQHYFYDRKSSFENKSSSENLKSKKVSRKDSMLKGIGMRRKVNSARSKSYDAPEPPPAEPVPQFVPAPNPPIIYGSSKPPTRNVAMWKPVGPKT